MLVTLHVDAQELAGILSTDAPPYPFPFTQHAPVDRMHQCIHHCMYHCMLLKGLSRTRHTISCYTLTSNFSRRVLRVRRAFSLQLHRNSSPCTYDRAVPSMHARPGPSCKCRQGKYTLPACTFCVGRVDTAPVCVATLAVGRGGSSSAVEVAIAAMATVLVWTALAVVWVWRRCAIGFKAPPDTQHDANRTHDACGRQAYILCIITHNNYLVGRCCSAGRLPAPRRWTRGRY